MTKAWLDHKTDGIVTSRAPARGALTRLLAAGAAAKGLLQHTGAGSECAGCGKKRLQRRAGGRGGIATVPESVHQVLRSPGRPLDPATRAFMEPRFGHDFSAVRVHTDAGAAQSAHAVNALAYTVGQDVVFASGRYAPDTTAGRQLLAHELAHTIQQARGPSASPQMASALQASALQVSEPGDRWEREADAQAARVTAGQTVAPGLLKGPASRGWLLRQADISQAPPGLPCVLTAGAGHTPGTDIMFTLSSAILTGRARTAIAAFARSWVAGGSSDEVMVDGWASNDGPEELNWRLSCDRAEAVKAELVAQGVSDAKITTFAHGRTDEFSASDLTANRRAIITRIPSAPPGPVPPVPPPPAPAPPAPAPAITSQTVAPGPGSRARTFIGVGEEVDLTFSLGVTHWTVLNAAGGRIRGLLDREDGDTVRLTAPDTSQIIIVTAGGVALLFFVIAPNDVHMDRFPGTGVKHTQNHADSGIETQPFLLPDYVNFYNVVYHELNVNAIVSSPGPYSCFSVNTGHCGAAVGSCGDLAMTNTVVAGKGTQAVLGDCVYSGDCQQTPPFTPGIIMFSIPYEYRVGANPFHHFRTVIQLSALLADKSTLTSDKAGAHGDTTVAAASVAIAVCP